MLHTTLRSSAPAVLLMLVVVTPMVGGARCGVPDVGEGEGEGEGEGGGEGEGEGEGVGEGEGEPCPTDIPADYRCVDGALVCAAPADDGACRLFEDVDGCPTLLCLSTCGGDGVDPECVEDRPGGERSAHCPAGAVPASSCECLDKCDCDAGEVCVDNACVPPPALCASAADCPRGGLVDGVDRCELFACNGFTDRCFSPGPIACAVDDECRETCLPGTSCVCRESVCQDEGACVDDGDCRDAYCSVDGRCVAFTSCVIDADCAPAEACDGAAGLCDETGRCDVDADCGDPRFPSCFEERCVTLSCLAAVICPAPLVCDAVGRCVDSAAGPCAVDGDCDADRYCAPAGCTVGCRDDASCRADELCSDHRCVDPAAGAAFGEPCVDDAGCASGLCGALNGTCAEACVAGGVWLPISLLILMLWALDEKNTPHSPR